MDILVDLLTFIATSDIFLDLYRIEIVFYS